MIFVHLADIHIPNFKRHKQYNLVFKDLYTKIPECDRIVIAGDIAHSKIDISPEFVSLCSDFLTNLARIAPVDIILGNHDLNLGNKNRLDAITPIIDNLNLDNITLYKKSGIYAINDKFQYAVFSCVDENYPIVSTNDKVTIALFHGMLNHAKPDNYKNFLLKNKILFKSTNTLKLFENCDYGFLGDLHLHQHITDKFAYPGSITQQNAGEDLDKGFLVWNISDKETFNVQRVNLHIPDPICTIEVDQNYNVINSTGVIDGCTLRVFSKFKIDESKIKLSYPNCNVSIIRNQRNSDVGSINATNLTQYLSQIGMSDDGIKEVIKIDELVAQNIEHDFSYGNYWHITNMKWSNLFSYGEDNEFDLIRDGIVGIVGDNGVGKSSIVDIMLWTIFGSISKRCKKNSWIVRHGCTHAWAEIIISDSHGDSYIINRSITVKKEDSSSAKLTIHKINSDGSQLSLNGIDKNDTERVIRSIFGTYESFIMTSAAPSGTMSNFINSKGAERFDLLSTFLGIDIFKKKHEIAKKQSEDLRIQVKSLSELCDDNEITKLSSEIIKYQHVCSDLMQKIDVMGMRSSKLDNKILKLTSMIANNIDDINIDKVNNDIDLLGEKINCANSEIDLCYNDLGRHIGGIHKYHENLVDTISNPQDCLNQLLSLYSSVDRDVQMATKDIESIRRRVSILDDINCDNEECVLIKDLIAENKKLTQINDTREKLIREKMSFQLSIDEHKLLVAAYEAQVASNNKNISSINLSKHQINLIRQKIDNLESQVLYDLNQLASYNNLLTKYNQNQDLIKKNKIINQNIDMLNDQKRSLQQELDHLRQLYNNSFQLLGINQSRHDDLVTLRDKFRMLKTQYEIYQSYIGATSRSGLPNKIIMDNLGVINDEIALVLNNIGMKFSVKFVSNDDELDLYIYDNNNNRHLELSSSSEMHIVSLAIRLALINVCNLSKPDFMIIDESFGVFDQVRLENFVEIFTYMSSLFRNIFIITHVSSIKKLFDNYVEIHMCDRISSLQGNS